MKLNTICIKFDQKIKKTPKFWTFEAIFQPCLFHSWIYWYYCINSRHGWQQCSG